MTKRTRRIFSAEFKLESAQLVLDQNYSIIEAAQAMNVGKSTMDKWVGRVEKHNEILKKATVLLMSDSLLNLQLSSCFNGVTA